MKRTLVFGTGYFFRYYKDYIYETYDVYGFLDNDKHKQGTYIDGKLVYTPAELCEIEYDEILIVSNQFWREMEKQLAEINIPKDKINLEFIHNPIIQNMCQLIKKVGTLANKTILDVGCGNGEVVKHIAAKYKPKMVIGIDPCCNEEERGDNYILGNGDAERMNFEDDSFDIVYSQAAFEHIKDIQAALSEIKRVLKPAGKFYCTFGHIWTCIRGHHDNREDEEFIAIPPWGHLYMSEQEFVEHYKMKGLNDEDIKSRLTYMNTALNYHSRTNLAKWIVSSGMWVREYQEWIQFSRNPNECPSEMTEDIREKIVNAGYSLEDVGVSSMYFLLEKFDLR